MGDTLAAIHYYIPSAKRQLPVCWSLHRAWGRSELPARACSDTPPILHAMCGLLIHWGFWRDSLLAFVAFDLVLRTGEMLELRGMDVEVGTCVDGMVLRLRGTKVGQRRGEDEAVVVDDTLVRAALRLLAADLEPGDLLSGTQEHLWRYRWNAAVRALKLSRLDIRPYSRRRGGATWLFRKSGSFDRCLDRGRWGNSRNARTYIEDAAAMAAGLRLAPEDQQCVDSHGQSFFVWLKKFVDAAAIQRSDHFNSNASATTTPRSAVGLPATPSGALVRKRPAADRVPCAPREPQPALPSASAVGIVPRAEAEVPSPRTSLVTASDPALQRVVRDVPRALQL